METLFNLVVPNRFAMAWLAATAVESVSQSGAFTYRIRVSNDVSVLPRNQKGYRLLTAQR